MPTVSDSTDSRSGLSRSLTGAQTERTSKETLFEAIRSAMERVESDIAGGPIVPMVTPQEIRDHLGSHYDFAKPRSLEDVGADIERMLRTWQTHVTHPRYFGLFNPSVTVASVVADSLVAMYNPQLASLASPATPPRLSQLGARRQIFRR